MNNYGDSEGWYVVTYSEDSSFKVLAKELCSYNPTVIVGKSFADMDDSYYELTIEMLKQPKKCPKGKYAFCSYTSETFFELVNKTKVCWALHYEECSDYILEVNKSKSSKEKKIKLILLDDNCCINLKRRNVKDSKVLISYGLFQTGEPNTIILPPKGIGDSIKADLWHYNDKIRFIRTKDNADYILQCMKLDIIANIPFHVYAILAYYIGNKKGISINEIKSTSFGRYLNNEELTLKAKSSQIVAYAHMYMLTLQSDKSGKYRNELCDFQGYSEATEYILKYMEKNVIKDALDLDNTKSIRKIYAVSVLKLRRALYYFENEEKIDEVLPYLFSSKVIVSRQQFIDALQLTRDIVYIAEELCTNP